MHGNLSEIIQTIGYLGVFAIVFAESGLFIGFFLPGDSLLFTAGFLASQNFFDITLLALGCFLAAVTGDSAGYYFGHKVGKRIFRREDSLFFHKDHLLKAERFYEKHGGKTIILARFMPVIRTFAPIVAGVGSMRYTTFLLYNLVGGLLWAVGITFAGFFLGSMVPDVDKYLLPIIAAIIIASVCPGFYHALNTKEKRRHVVALFKSVVIKRSRNTG